MTAEFTITGDLPSGNMTASVTYFIIDTATKAVVGSVMLPSAASEKFHSVAMPVRLPSATASYAIGTFDENGNFKPASHLRVGPPANGNGARPTGAQGRLAQ